MQSNKVARNSITKKPRSASSSPTKKSLQPLRSATSYNSIEYGVLTGSTIYSQQDTSWVRNEQVVNYRTNNNSNNNKNIFTRNTNVEQMEQNEMEKEKIIKSITYQGVTIHGNLSKSINKVYTTFATSKSLPGKEMKDIPCGFCGGCNMQWCLKCTFCGCRRVSDTPRMSYIISMFMNVNPNITANETDKHFHEVTLQRAKVGITLMSRVIGTLQGKLLHFQFMAWKKYILDCKRAFNSKKASTKLKRIQHVHHMTTTCFQIWKGFYQERSQQREICLHKAIKMSEKHQKKKCWNGWNRFIRHSLKMKLDKATQENDFLKREMNRFYKAQSYKGTTMGGNTIFEAFEKTKRLLNDAVEFMFYRLGQDYQEIQRLEHVFQMIKIFPDTIGLIYNIAEMENEEVYATHAKLWREETKVDCNRLTLEQLSIRNNLEQNKKNSTVNGIHNDLFHCYPEESHKMDIPYDGGFSSDMKSISCNSRQISKDEIMASDNLDQNRDDVDVVNDEEKEKKTIAWTTSLEYSGARNYNNTLQELRNIRNVSEGLYRDVAIKLMNCLPEEIVSKWYSAITENSSETSSSKRASSSKSPLDFLDKLRDLDLLETHFMKAVKLDLRSKEIATKEIDYFLRAEMYLQRMRQDLGLPESVIEADELSRGDFEWTYSYIAYLYLHHPAYIFPSRLKENDNSMCITETNTKSKLENLGILKEEWEKLKNEPLSTILSYESFQKTQDFLVKLRLSMKTAHNQIFALHKGESANQLSKHVVSKNLVDGMSQRVRGRSSSSFQRYEDACSHSQVTLNRIKIRDLHIQEETISRTEDVLARYYSRLKKIYRSYAQRDGGVNMDRSEFVAFIRDCKLTNRKTLPLAEIDILFAYVNRVVENDDDNSNPEQELTFQEFIEALVRLSVLLNGTEQTPPFDLVQSVTKLLSEKVFPNAACYQGDGFKKEMTENDVSSILKHHFHELQDAFKKYSSTSLRMDVKSFLNLMKDKHLIDVSFTQRDVIKIFNYIQHDDGTSKEDETLNAVVAFPEFTEGIVATAVYKNPDPYLNLAKKLEMFLSITFPKSTMKRHT